VPSGNTYAGAQVKFSQVTFNKKAMTVALHVHTHVRNKTKVK